MLTKGKTKYVISIQFVNKTTKQKQKLHNKNTSLNIVLFANMYNVISLLFYIY